MPLESTITSTAEGYYRLKLEGRIHRPHWVAQLFSALAGLRISVVSGEAMQTKGGDWTSSFLLDFSGSAADPQHLNFSAFTEQPAGDRPPPPKLTRFEIVRNTEQLIELRLEGPDQVGFLASILLRVSGLALFPSKLEIDTVAGRIKDAVTLRGIGDRGPSEAAYQSLERMLKSFMVNA
jgi:hypothetical protein